MTLSDYLKLKSETERRIAGMINAEMEKFEEVTKTSVTGIMFHTEAFSIVTKPDLTRVGSMTIETSAKLDAVELTRAD